MSRRSNRGSGSGPPSSRPRSQGPSSQSVEPLCFLRRKANFIKADWLYDIRLRAWSSAAPRAPQNQGARGAALATGGLVLPGEYHLERVVLVGGAKHVIGRLDIAQRETVGAELFGLDAPVAGELEQRRDRDDHVRRVHHAWILGGVPGPLSRTAEHECLHPGLSLIRCSRRCLTGGQAMQGHEL